MNGRAATKERFMTSYEKYQINNKQKTMDHTHDIKHRIYSKIRAIGITIIILTTAFSCANLKKEKETNQGEFPNIVLLMGDDHGWDDIGYNGHPYVENTGTG
jgi:hypothetical protein